MALQDQLEVATYFGDQEFVADCISDQTATGVWWGDLLTIAYEENHKDIVYCIQDSGKLPLWTQLEEACWFGELEFVSHCIVKNKGEAIDWGSLMHIGWEGGQMEVVKCILVSGIVSQEHLESVIRWGDHALMSYLSDHIDQEVDWQRLLDFAFQKKEKQIVEVLQNIGKVNLNDQLELASMYSDFIFISYHLSNSEIQRAVWLKCTEIAMENNNWEIAQTIITQTNVMLEELPLGIIQHYLYNTVVTSMIDQMSNVNAVLRSDFTALHIACYGANDKLVRALCRKGADVHVPGFRKYTALHMLCLGRNSELDRLIHQRDGRSDKCDEKIYEDRHKMLKCKESKMSDGKFRKELAEYLLIRGACVNSVDVNHQTPLHHACASGKVNVASVLLKYGANINQLDGTRTSPLLIAAFHGHCNVVKVLLEKECHIYQMNRYGQSALYLSCRMNREDVVKILLEKTRLVNKYDNDHVTPLSVATMYGHETLITQLILHGSDLELVDKEHQTPLHKAAKVDCSSSVDMLCQYREILDVQDIQGSTALHLASYNNPETVVYLLYAGCAIDTRNNLGNTALHIAVMAKHLNIGRILLHSQADVNIRNNCGESPMMSAVSNLDIDMVNLLLDHNADVHTVDNLGRGLIHTVITSIKHESLLKSMISSAETISSHSILGLDGYTLATLIDKSGSTSRFLVKGKVQKKKAEVKEQSEVFNKSVTNTLLQSLNVNAKDYNGQTALHLSAESGNLLAVHFLLEHGANPMIRDKFGHLPILAAVRHPQVFDLLMSQVQHLLTQADEHEAARLCHWFDVSCSWLVCHTRTVHAGAQNVKKLQWSIKMEILTPLMMTMEDRNTPEFTASWLSSLQPLTYISHSHIIETLSCLVNDLAVEIANIEPLVAFEFKLSGSECEKTKVMATNELDALCVLKNILQHMFHMPQEPFSPVLKECVELVCKDEYVSKLSRILCDKKKLSSAKLFVFFSRAVSQVLQNPNFLDKYENIQRVTVKDITAGNRTITALNVRWHDDVYPLLDISIDIVPAISLPCVKDGGWLPSWFYPHPKLPQMGCVIIPKWKSSAPTELTLLEVGISRWGEIFDEMPEEMRQGYRMAKVVRDQAVCPQIEDWDEVHASDFITSYMLKQCIFKEYMVSRDGDSAHSQSDMDWARRIYEMIEAGFINQHLESFFIPGYNLIHDDKYIQYRETAISYAKLCRRLLTPEASSHFRRAYMGIHELNNQNYKVVRH